MLPRDDFIFTIGYDGPAAVIDSQARRRNKGLSTQALIDKGLFRAAYSSAVYSKNPDELRLVADAFGRLSDSTVDIAVMDRLFGVFPVDVKRSLVL